MVGNPAYNAANNILQHIAVICFNPFHALYVVQDIH